jgi:hypothetical protein
MHHDLLMTLRGVLGLTAIIIGLCSHRVTTALIWGTIFGSLWAMAPIAAVISVSIEGGDLQSPGLITGRIFGSVITLGFFGLFGHGIRRGLSALFRRLRKSPTPQSSEV